MKRLRLTSLGRFTLAVLAVTLMISATPAKASLLAGFAGNTQPRNIGLSGLQGYVNFAVYDTTGGVAGDHFGTGITDAVLTAAGFNVTSSYLFLFQSANNGTLEISQNTVAVPFATVTGLGILAGRGFSDGTAVSSTNPFGTAGAPGDTAAASIGVTTPSIILTGGLQTPVSVLQTLSSLAATFIPPATGLAPGSISSLWGYTTNLPPAWTTTTIQDGGTSAQGTVPGVVPEPATMGSALAGLLLAGGYYLRRRKV